MVESMTAPCVNSLSLFSVRSIGPGPEIAIKVVLISSSAGLSIMLFYPVASDLFG